VWQWPQLYPRKPPQYAGHFSAFQANIQEMVSNGYTNNIVAELARRGLTTKKRTLKRRLHLWGIRRPNGTPGVTIGGITDEFAEAVYYTFHHTTLNDDQIAARVLEDYKLHTTRRQVKSIRSLFR
jgi:hypothetical protein